ncbi:MAG TPA: FMN reductase [Pseudonocardiaceae bacterium]|jgi:FMN reductase|nr:FMN reductase [Pseudonocardiaceae bacterium]
MRIAVVTAGLSNPSSTRVLADQLAAATRRRFDSAAEPVEFDVIELRELGHPLVDNLLTGFPNDALKQAIAQVTGADGLIAVTPIFTASYNALFKAFFDVLDADALTGMPVLIGATGGTERHSLALDHALRPLFSYLRALVVPTAVYAASSDFGARDGDTAGLARRIDRAAEEFATLVRSVPRKQVADPYADVVSFESLLAG